MMCSACDPSSLVHPKYKKPNTNSLGPKFMAEEKIVLNLYWANMLSRPASRVASVATRGCNVPEPAAAVAQECPVLHRELTPERVGRL
jgi:hypothetical protein